MLLEIGLLNELSRWIIQGKVETNTPMVIDVFDGQVVFRKPLQDEEKVNGEEKRKRKKAEA